MMAPLVSDLTSIICAVRLVAQRITVQDPRHNYNTLTQHFGVFKCGLFFIDMFSDQTLVDLLKS